MYVCCQHFQTSPLKPLGRLKPNFMWSLLRKGEHMPIYSKKLKKKSSSLEPKGQWPWNLVYSIGCMSTTNQICSNDDPGLTLTYFRARSNLVPYALLWEKGKTMDFSETVVVYDLKLAVDVQSNKKFLLISKLCPLGAICPLLRGYIHVLNHKKIV